MLDEAYYEYVTGLHVPRRPGPAAALPELRRASHVLEGLRPGVAAHRLPDGPPAGRSAPSTRCSSRSPSTAWPRPPPWRRSAATTSCASGSPAPSRSGPAVQGACAASATRRARRPGQLRVAPRRRAAAAALTLRAGDSWASSPGRSPPKACGSRWATPEEDEQFLDAFERGRRPAGAGRHWGLPTGHTPGGAGLDGADRRRRRPPRRPRGHLAPRPHRRPTPGGPSSGTPAGSGAHLAEIGGLLAGRAGALSTLPATSPSPSAGEDRPGPRSPPSSRAAAARSPSNLALTRRNLSACAPTWPGCRPRTGAAGRPPPDLGEMDVPRQLAGVPHRPRRAAPRPARRPGPLLTA